MTNDKKSTSLLLGRIYERTEQTAKILPVIQEDISDMKDKLNKDHYRIKSLERAGVGYNIWKIIRVFLGIK